MKMSEERRYGTVARAERRLDVEVAIDVEEDVQWTEVNYAFPFWRGAGDCLEGLKTNLMVPIDQFCGLLKKQKNELVACACCWIWVPLYLLYLVAIAVILCFFATVTAIFGFIQSLIFLVIGIWPGFIIAIGITCISIIRIPWNVYYHFIITGRNIKQGNYIKAMSFFLLLPVHIIFPIIITVVSTSAIAVSSVLAFFGCPQTPWTKMAWVHQQVWHQLATSVEENVKNVKDDNSLNYATPSWIKAEEVCTTTLTKIFLLPMPLFNKIKPDFGFGSVVIIFFFPLWIPLVLAYFLVFIVIVCITTVPFIVIGIIQSLIHMLFGIWPGIIFAIYLTVFSIIRIPWNIYYHCIVISKIIKKGHFIQAINFLLLLPAHFLAPVILGLGSLGAGTLASATISLLGCPQVPWRELTSFRKQAHNKIITDVRDIVNNYSLNSEDDEENYATPYWMAVMKALETLADVLKSPSSYLSEASKSTTRTVLCCPLWIPVGLAYILLTSLIFFAVAAPLITVGLIQSLIFLILGIWPGFIIGIGVTGISIIRIPWNIFYHVLVTYRTVLLRRSLKVGSIILVPPTHLLVPVVIAVVSFGACIPACAAVAFFGKPQKPWLKLPHLVKKFWRRYVTDVKAHVDNYGHESGIPQNWDGRIYGLPLDPITIVMVILFYFYAVIPVTVGVIAILCIKAIPILIRGVVGYVKTMNPFKATKAWAELIGNFGQFNACGQFANIITEYFSFVKYFNPADILESISGYSKECNVCKCVPKDGCEAFMVSPCILMVSIFWIFGLLVVILTMIIKTALGFLAWILGWVFAIFGPPILYLLCWVALLILLPVCYTILWILGFCFTILLPWPFLAITMLSGPFLAIKVPYVVFKYNLLNPAGMDQSFKMGLRKPLDIIKDMDRTTGHFCFKKWTIWEHAEEDATDNMVQREIKYWDLFFERSTKEISQIITKNWLTADDIAEACSTAMIAIPGFTILSVLVESVKKEEQDKSLIYWDEKNQCSNKTRDPRDNICNHFFPLLIKLKGGLKAPDNLDDAHVFITASLCDGDDEKTKDLREYLETQVIEETEKKKYLKIRSELENLVHSLLRVEKMQNMLNKLCQYDYQTMPNIRKDSHTESEDQV